MWALLPYLKVKLPSLAESIKTVPWNGKGTRAELVLSIVEIAPYCFRLCEWQVWSCDLGTNIPLCVLFDPCSRVPGQYPLPCSHNTWRMYAGHVRHQLWDQDAFDLAVQHSSCKKLKLLGLLEEVFEEVIEEIGAKRDACPHRGLEHGSVPMHGVCRSFFLPDELQSWTTVAICCIPELTWKHSFLSVLVVPWNGLNYQWDLVIYSGD